MATSACVWPRVNSAEPCARGSTVVSIDDLANFSSGRGRRRACRCRAPASEARCTRSHRRGTRCPCRCRGTRRAAARFTSTFTASTAAMRVCLSCWLIASTIFPSARSFTRATMLASGSAFFHAILSWRDSDEHLVLERDQLLDSAVGDIERLENVVFGTPRSRRPRPS